MESGVQGVWVYSVFKEHIAGRGPAMRAQSGPAASPHGLCFSASLAVSLRPSWAGGVPRPGLQHGMLRHSVPGLFSMETQLSRASSIVFEVPALVPLPRGA